MADTLPRPNVQMLAAVALLSAAMLAFQLTLTRLFAVAQFYHFAFMVISLALLGSGAAGSLLTVQPALGGSPARWAAGFGLAAVTSYAVMNLIPFDSYAIAWDRRQVLYLLLTLLGTTAPFFFGGLVIGGLMTSAPQALHRIYAANLGGSAVGCLAILPVLASLGGEAALLLSAAVGVVAVPLLMPSRQGGHAKAQAAGMAVLAGLLLMLAVMRPEWASIRLSPYKGLTQALLAPGAVHAVSEWSTAARIDVVESQSIHTMPGLSQNALIMRPPEQLGLTLDGDDLQPITGLSPEDNLARELAGYVPQAIIPALRSEAGSMLILEPGGGWDVLMALANGAPAATVVERHEIVADLLQGQYADFTGDIYNDPRVTLVTAHGRTFVRQTDQSYDAIIISLSDSFHPVTSGAYSLREDYRYTVEALEDTLDRLSPGGVLVMMRWLQSPPTECVRTLATLEAALRARGIEAPEEHIAAFREIRTMTFVVSNEPLSAADRTTIRALVDSRGYDLVWLSDVSPDEVNVHNRLPEPVYYEAFAGLLQNPQEFIENYEFDIRPPTDNRPFFFHYFRWRQTPQIMAELGQTWQPFGGSGYFVLVALLGIVLILAIVLIFGPLAAGRRRIAPVAAPLSIRLRTLVYFVMLGLGFLFIEIPLAQHFILFLDQPVTALAVVIFGLLLFSGLGSATAPRWRLDAALGLLVVLALIAPVALRAIFAAALGLPLGVRMVIAVASLAPLGLLMGVPFARGMGLIERAAAGMVPWAWAINGSASVISGVLAVMIALSAGFSAVLWIGAACYGVALLATWPLRADHDPAGNQRNSPA